MLISRHQGRKSTHLFGIYERKLFTKPQIGSEQPIFFNQREALLKCRSNALLQQIDFSDHLFLLFWFLLKGFEFVFLYVINELLQDIDKLELAYIGSLNIKANID